MHVFLVISINGWHGNNIFSLDIFCFMLWHLAEDEIRQSLEEKDSKNTWKKNIQSRSTSVS